MKQLNKQLSAFSTKSLMLLFIFALPPTMASAQCPDNNHPHMIDLGLPSGTKWACCNVGASKPEDNGRYYAWGETTEKDYYDWSTYSYCDGSYDTCHNIGNDIAGTQYDAATANWGSPWVMPSKEQMEELNYNCNSEWTTENGVDGRRFTASNGVSIFFPAAGYRLRDYLASDGLSANYSSSSFDESSTFSAWGLFFGDEFVNMGGGSRNCGQSVRPVVVSSPSGIPINEETFPDKNFRNWVLAQDYGKDGVLTNDEIAEVTEIKVFYQGIADLKGIEYFRALTSLHCSGNPLVKLDVSQNNALEYLNCSRCQLTSLDVSKNTALTSLNCTGNQLTLLDVSKNVALNNIDCNENQLASLDVSKNTALEKMTCYSNQLTSLNVSKNIALTELWCNDNQLTALDVSNNLELIYLQCGSNQLNSLDVSKCSALTGLNCCSTKLTTLDVSKNNALTILSCWDNQLTALDVSKNTLLTTLECYTNQIKGSAMDALITSLPETGGNFIAIAPNAPDEQNVVTKAQVAAARQKGWITYTNIWNQALLTWEEYEGSAPVAEGNIVFADEAVKALCIQNWDTDGDGELSYAEAAAVTDLGEVFKNNEEITSFNELQYFIGLNSIGNWAFNHCTGLTSVVIPEFVTSIASTAFNSCSNLASIKVESGNAKYDSRDDCNAIIETETNTLFAGCMNTIIPQTVTSIGDRAFFNCTGLESITIPNSVTYISGAFYGSGLTSVTIPNSVTTVDTWAFGYCRNLATVHFGNSVTKIGDMAFYLCDALTSVTIPSSVTSIGSNAFGNCSSLASIIVETGNTKYDSRDDCNAIIETETNKLIRGCMNTIIPNSVTSIGWNALSGNCPVSVTIPKSVTFIEEYAFGSSTTEFRSLITEPFEISPNCWYSVNTDEIPLYVPAGTKEKYEATAGWNVFKNIVEMGLLPVDEGETIDIGNEINEETNLDGTVVDNVFVNISNGDGGFDPVEGCLIVSKPTDDSAINGKDIFGDDFKDNYTGIVFKVNEGKGSIKVEAETQGNMVLKVKIGNSDPIEMELDGKLKVKFPYNVSEETLVYIYGGLSDAAGAKATGGTRASSSADLLKIYGFEVVSDQTGIETIGVGESTTPDAPVYNLNGQRVNKAGKGIYIKNGKKVLVK